MEKRRGGIYIISASLTLLLLCLSGCSGGTENKEQQQPEEAPKTASNEVTMVPSLASVSCDVDLADCEGICTDTTDDPKNCGACGLTCDSEQVCEKGMCTKLDPCASGVCECVAPEVECSKKCVNLEADPLHCGDCDTVCGQESSCKLGECICIDEDDVLCDDTCVNLNVDSQNCGSCDNFCTGDEQCFNGACGCGPNALSCGDTCVDELSNAEHCGSCNFACADGQRCDDGACLTEAATDDCTEVPLHIALTRVSIYQGVEVDLFRDGAAVALENQAVDLIAQRRALARLFIAPKTEYQKQSLSGRVYVRNGDVTQIFFEKKEVNTSASSGPQLKSTLNVELPAEAIQENTEIWARIMACDPQDAGEPEVVRFPSERASSFPLSAKTTGVIKVAFLPIRHDNRIPDTSAATINEYVKEVEKLYPTSGVEATILPEMNSGQNGSIDLEDLLYDAEDRRFADSPTSDLYYYGLVDPAESFASYCNRSCTTGLGFVLDSASKTYKVAVGIGFGTVGVQTFSHELGHNHGRTHAPCGLGGGNKDDDYPGEYTLEEEGIFASIGVRGYDFFTQELKEAFADDPRAAHRDHMSYCGPEWVSDYGFNIYANRIAAVNGVAPAAFQRRQIGTTQVNWHRIAVSPHTARWLTQQVDSTQPSGLRTSVIVYDRSGQETASVEAFQINLADSEDYLLLVPPNEPEWFALGLPNGTVLPY